MAYEDKDSDAEIHETEPEIIHELIVDDLRAVKVPGAVRFSGYITILSAAGRPVEKRVQLRFTAPDRALTGLCAALCGSKGKDKQ